MTDAAEDAQRRRRRAELLAQRAAVLDWRARLLARRRRHIEQRQAWVRHLLER